MIATTRELAWAAATDAANAQMREQGRRAWDIEDKALAAVVFARLWPVERDVRKMEW